MNIPIEYSLLFILIVAFILTYIATPFFIRKLTHKGFVSEDMNKKDKPKVAKFGGVAVFFGFIVAFLLILQLSPAFISPIVLLGIALSISLISFLGFIDDVLDIRPLYRIILPLFAAFPLMLLKVGTAVMVFPFIGPVNLYIENLAIPFLGVINLNLYVLFFIPIGVIVCSNIVNLLAGFNGLEVGTGIIISLFLILFLLLSGLNPNRITALTLLCALIGALAAFLIFNWYPAKVFPGNILTYLIGAAIAVVVIIGNIERAGVILLAPQIIELFLKSLSKFEAENFGKCIDGRLHYDGKIYSLTHLLMKLFHPTEVQLVLMLYLLQIISGFIALLSLSL